MSDKCEFHHIHNHVKEEADAGIFTGSEVWIGTDSNVYERIFHKGGSTNKELHKIMLDMR